MFMKPVILLSLVVFSLSCANRQNNFRGTENLEQADLITDTIYLSDLPGDSTSTSELIPITVPKTTKIVKWYSIGYMPDGTGLLKVTTEDDVNYDVKLNNSAVVAAASNLLQNAYVRLDTVTKEIYSYKTTVTATLRPF